MNTHTHTQIHIFSSLSFPLSPFSDICGLEPTCACWCLLVVLWWVGLLLLLIELASISIPNDQLRDPDAVYNKRTLDELQTSTPFIFWEALLSAAGYPVDSSAPVIVESPTYLEQLDALLSNTDLQVLSTYFTLRLLESYSAELPSAFADEAFDWSSKISGVKSPPTRFTLLPLLTCSSLSSPCDYSSPESFLLKASSSLGCRWKTCVQLTDRYLGEMVGRLYIQEKFPGNSKEVCFGDLCSFPMCPFFTSFRSEGCSARWHGYCNTPLFTNTVGKWGCLHFS